MCDTDPGIFIPLWLLWKALFVAAGVCALWGAFRLGRWSAKPLPTFEDEDEAHRPTPLFARKAGARA